MSKSAREIWFNTDKSIHGYYPAYMDIFEKIKTAKAICEVGVFLGGSLDFFRHIFPKAKIVGVDINEQSRWPEGAIKLIQEQTNPDLPKQLREISPEGYELIVDDASHIAPLTRRTWELCWPLVKESGYYVIEDVQVSYPNSPHFKDHGTSAIDMAKEFIDLLDIPGREDIESIEYRHGLIIFRKVAYLGMQGKEKTIIDLKVMGL